MDTLTQAQQFLLDLLGAHEGGIPETVLFKAAGAWDSNFTPVKVRYCLAQLKQDGLAKEERTPLAHRWEVVKPQEQTSARA